MATLAANNITVANVITLTGNIQGAANALQGDAIAITSVGDIVLIPGGGATVSVDGQMDVNGNLTAQFFIGDGINLSNVRPSILVNGTSDVNIPVANGNIELAVANVDRLFVTPGGISVVGNVIATNNITSNGASVTGNVTATNTVTANVYQQGQFAIGNTLGNLSANCNITLGSIQSATLTGNITLNTITNMAAGQNITLILTQDATGNRLMTSTMKFAGNSRTLTTFGGATDIISIYFDGTNYWASLTKGYA